MRLETSKRPDSDIFWTSFEDNKFLDEAYKEWLRSLALEDEYFHSVYTLGLWTPLKIEGIIYRKFVEKEFPLGNILEHKYNHNLALYICCDFNVNPMKWAVIQNLQGNDYIFDEVVQQDTYTELMAKEVKLRYGERKYYIYGDYSGTARSTKSNLTDFQIIENVLGDVELCIKPNPPIIDRINAVNWRLCNASGIRRLFINPKCEHTIKDFRNVRWDGDKKKEEQKPESDLTHISSAVGYYIENRYSLKGQNTFKQK